LHNTPSRGHEKEAFERLTGREPSASVLLLASFSFPAFDLQEDVPDSGLAMGVAPCKSSAAHIRWQLEHGGGYSRMASLEA